MDNEGPFRAPRPTDRRGVVKPEPITRQPEEPQQPQRPQSAEPVKEEAEVAREQPVAPVKVKPIKPIREAGPRMARPRFVLPVIILVILIIILGVVGWIVLQKPQTENVAIDTSKYQAVFFTNQQVYFGKLKMLNSEYMELDNVYYLQTQSSTGTTSTSQTSTSDQTSVLVRLDSAVHGPEDTMIIAKDQVLYYENLKPTGKVAQLITSAQK